jgi:hypothetical protein
MHDLFVPKHGFGRAILWAHVCVYQHADPKELTKTLRDGLLHFLSIEGRLTEVRISYNPQVARHETGNAARQDRAKLTLRCCQKLPCQPFRLSSPWIPSIPGIFARRKDCIPRRLSGSGSLGIKLVSV